MKAVRITVLVEHLLSLFAVTPNDVRLPSLEAFLSRARFTPGQSDDSDDVRFELFGHESGGSVPVAALTGLADRCDSEINELSQNDGSYYLRADPVTLRPDLSRVVMIGFGYADYEPQEQQQLSEIVRAVLRAEGMTVTSEQNGRWTIALEQPLDFQFPSLQKALGMDAAEVLPDHPQARSWRRLMNEIQMALYACSVNQKRREQGRPEVNSVWFWGGGRLPEPRPISGDKAVYTDHPVSKGLALLNSCQLKGLEVLCDGLPVVGKGMDIMIDWTPQPGDLHAQLQQIESLAAQLMHRTRQNNAHSEIVAGNGASWQFSRSSTWRFWQRRKPVSHWVPET